MVDLYQMRAAVFALAKTFLHGTTKYDHAQRMKVSAFDVTFLKHFYDEEFFAKGTITARCSCWISYSKRKTILT